MYPDSRRARVRTPPHRLETTAPSEDPQYGSPGFTPLASGPLHVVTTNTTASTDERTATTGEWAGIRYVFYVTFGWLVATARAVALLMTVVPRLL